MCDSNNYTITVVILNRNSVTLIKVLLVSHITEMLTCSIADSVQPRMHTIVTRPFPCKKVESEGQD